jgi:hypothetical protein
MWQSWILVYVLRVLQLNAVDETADETRVLTGMGSSSFMASFFCDDASPQQALGSLPQVEIQEAEDAQRDADACCNLSGALPGLVSWTPVFYQVYDVVHRLTKPSVTLSCH